MAKAVQRYHASQSLDRSSARQERRIRAWALGLSKQLEEFAAPTLVRDLKRDRREADALDREIANLTRAIAQGGQLPPLLEALKTAHARRETLTATIATRETTDITRIDRRAIENETRAVSTSGTRRSRLVWRARVRRCGRF